MKRTSSIALFSLAALMAAGCQQDFYARKIIEQDTNYGKLVLTMTGDADSLVKNKRIDLHHRIVTSDKTKIDVWIIKGKPPTPAEAANFKPAGTVAIIHGLLDSKASYLSLGEKISKLGYDVVLPDMRAHGASGGKYVTWGAKEKYDVKQVIDTLEKAKVLSAENIYAFGTSLGGAVAIQYAAIEPRVKGVMAMAPPKDITIVRRGMAILAPTMSDKDFNAVLARAGKLGDFDPAQASAIKAASTLKCPLLLVHGLLDMTVPVDNSSAIYKAANEPKQIIIVPWASHATLLLASEAWIANQIDNIAKTGLKKPAEEPKKP